MLSKERSNVTDNKQMLLILEFMLASDPLAGLTDYASI